MSEEQPEGLAIPLKGLGIPEEILLGTGGGNHWNDGYCFRGQVEDDPEVNP